MTHKRTLSINIMHSIKQEKIFLLALAGVFCIIFILSHYFPIGEAFFIRFLPGHMQAEHIFITCLESNQKNREQEKQCIKEGISQRIHALGAQPIADAFSAYATRHQETMALHSITHVLGVTLYDYMGDIEKTLVICPPAIHNGCQHGALIAFLEANPEAVLNPQRLAILCRQTSKTPGNYQLCLHGLGHSFFVFRKGDLPSALTDCEKLGLEGWINNQCWSGAFMENVDQGHFVFHKERMAQDPLYPCTEPTIDEKYLAACYSQLPIPSGTITAEKRFSICRLAPHKWIMACAQGIGISVAARNTSVYEPIIRYCRQGGDLTPMCLRGAIVYILVGENGSEHTKEFCARLTYEEANLCLPRDIKNTREIK